MDNFVTVIRASPYLSKWLTPQLPRFFVERTGTLLYPSLALPQVSDKRIFVLLKEFYKQMLQDNITKKAEGRGQMAEGEKYK